MGTTVILTRFRKSALATVPSLLVGAMTLLSSVETVAQTNVNYASVNVGIIRVYDQHSGVIEGTPYVLYPELQLGGDLFTPGLRWTVFWGYSDDRKAQVEYSHAAYSIHAVGARIAVLPVDLLPHWVIPLGVFVGAGYHAVTYRNIRGLTSSGANSQLPRTPADLSLDVFALEAGLNLEVRIYGPVAFRGEVRQLIPLEDGYPDGMMESRRSVTAGVAYRF